MKIGQETKLQGKGFNATPSGNGMSIVHEVDHDEDCTPKHKMMK